MFILWDVIFYLRPFIERECFFEVTYACSRASVTVNLEHFCCCQFQHPLHPLWTRLSRIDVDSTSRSYVCLHDSLFKFSTLIINGARNFDKSFMSFSLFLLFNIQCLMESFINIACAYIIKWKLKSDDKMTTSLYNQFLVAWSRT
jgi:hypothetical protein